MDKMSDCKRPDLGKQLYRWVRGEVDGADLRGEIAAHLDTCARCAATTQELRAILGTMRLPGGPDYDAELARGMNSILHPGAQNPAASGDAAPARHGWWSRLWRRRRST